MRSILQKSDNFCHCWESNHLPHTFHCACAETNCSLLAMSPFTVRPTGLALRFRSDKNMTSSPSVDANKTGNCHCRIHLGMTCPVENSHLCELRICYMPIYSVCRTWDLFLMGAVRKYHLGTQESCTCA
jgi:hypothetical protein